MNILQELEAIKERSELPTFLKKWGRNRKIVEVGVRYGYFLRQLLSADPGLLIGVDHWAAVPNDQDTSLTQDQLNEIYLNTMSDFLREKNVKLVRASSLQAIRLFSLSSLDFVYIDANHSYEGCKRDIQLWWPYVRQGGILAGHDFISTTARDGSEFGVVEAVNEFCKTIPGKYCYTTEEGYRTWMIYKSEGE